jgi:hypothetical protein
MVTRVQLSGLVLATAIVSVGSPAYSQEYAPSNSIQIQGQTFSSPPPVVYGDSMNSFGGGAFGNAIQQGLPIAQNLIGGGGLSGSIPGLLQLGQTYLPSNLQQYGGLASSLAQGLLSGNGVNVGGLISSGLPLLSSQLGLDSQTSGILGSAAPLVSDLLSGNFNAGSAINAGLGIAGQFLGNNPVFGVASGVLGGLFGGGGQKGTGIEVSETLQQIYTNPITAALNTQVFAGSKNSANTVLAQTGSVTCLYNLNCVQSNPSSYRGLYAASLGDMGFSNPNQVRGQVAQLSASGVRPDLFSTQQNSEQNSYYVGNQFDREISRASTQQYLSQAGQQAQMRAIQAGTKVGQQMSALGDKCDPSPSTQDLVRCSTKMSSVNAGFQAANLELQHKNSNDNQFIKNSLGNISDSTDKLNRSQDVEFSSAASRLVREVTIGFPITARK